ncbi:Disintegrin and metalloproteinase domain-containing protein 8 [Armadillidium vulgare]|nr:Disintegrin and metalloproteinase domain-containing protein 8 [Armadillidium vulgare]
MCTNDSAAVVQHFPKNVPLSIVAMTIGHEMGHTLGAQHDGQNCGFKSLRVKCIMTSSAWSNCSLMYIAKNIDRFHCLKNVPILLTKYSHCGNGRIDKDEQCDCGPVGSCSNPCCEAKTCKLKSHAVCASGICLRLKEHATNIQFVIRLETVKAYPSFGYHY